MKSTLYPTLAETLELHKRLIDRFGGSLGIRDRGLIESALARPQSGYYNSLSEQAAALLQSLALNHAFVDGNKRVAFTLSAVFLRMNGYRLIVETDNGEDFIVNQVIGAKANLEKITMWLELHMHKVDG